MKKQFTLFLLFLIFFSSLLDASFASPNIITFFIRPITKKKSDTEKVKENNEKIPTKGLKKILIKEPHSLAQAGIYSTYEGSSTFSDINGQITFERKTPVPNVYLLITENVKPILLNPFNRITISGFIVNPKAESQFYFLERKKNPETQQTSWYIKQEPLTKDQKIPPNTIILFADPQNIIVPTGIVSTPMSENLILPDLFITKNPYSALYALQFFKIREYFKPLKYKYNFAENEYQQMIMS